MNNLIDHTLHTLFIASFNYHSDNEGKRKHHAVDDITWYIWTGRASTPWIKALSKANPNKLLNHIAKQADTTDETVKATTSYLKRYCGYKC